VEKKEGVFQNKRLPCEGRGKEGGGKGVGFIKSSSGPRKPPLSQRGKDHSAWKTMVHWEPNQKKNIKIESARYIKGACPKTKRSQGGAQSVGKKTKNAPGSKKV